MKHVTEIHVELSKNLSQLNENLGKKSVMELHKQKRLHEGLSKDHIVTE